MITLICTALPGLLLLPLLLSFIFPYIFQDTFYFITFLRFIIKSWRYGSRTPVHTVVDLFLEQVDKCPDKPFLIFKDEVYSYSKVDKLSNQAARALRKHGGVKSGDCVALFMGNAPAYIWIWLGLAKLGCSMACLNNNIRSQSLLHCFRCSGSKLIIAAPELSGAIEEVMPALKKENVRVFYLSETPIGEGTESFMDKVEAALDDSVPKSLRSFVNLKSLALYVYTSGTTAMLKEASRIPARFAPSGVLYQGVMSRAGLNVTVFEVEFNFTRNMTRSAEVSRRRGDESPFLIPIQGRVVTVLPLTRRQLGGATVVLREKFSASQFWEDCRKYNVTVVLYIGETLRYLCNVPKKEDDASHNVRMAIGNGLRTDVWNEFIKRFGDIRICEFYAATEGNIIFINYTNTIGAVGRMSYLYKTLLPCELIKYDIEKDEPLRDAKGRCMKVRKGQPGLLVSKITKVSPFGGYAGDPSQNENKMLRDVFRKGDVYFNTGDLLMVDQQKFIYFHDRVGDTFRWKGENVATTEVADILGLVNFIQEIIIYGVPVPNHEGRIGMASLRLKDGQEFDGRKLYSHVMDFLPNYARPRFVRIQDILEITATYKQRKVKLVEDGFDPSIISDPLYILDDKEKKYVPMTQTIYDHIKDRKIKL